MTDNQASRRDTLNALAEAVRLMPDDIEVYRLMAATKSMKRGVQAKAVAARIEEIRAAANAVLAQQEDT